MIFFCLRWQNHTNSDSRCCAGVPCGVTNPNMDVKGRNPDALQLGAEIGSVVMGQEEWEKYITTSVKAMKKEHRPTPQLVSQKLAAERPSGEREGWVFHHVARDASWDASMWAMIDQIDVGHDRPDHFYLARPHRRKSRVTISARSYFRSIPQKLVSILGRKEQGPEGHGCWYEVEPVPPDLS